jgi:hypothetical protein
VVCNANAQTPSDGQRKIPCWTAHTPCQGAFIAQFLAGHSSKIHLVAATEIAMAVVDGDLSSSFNMFSIALEAVTDEV